MEVTQIEGRRPVLEALRSGRPLLRVLVAAGATGAALAEIARLAGARGVPLEQRPAAELGRRARTRAHQGVIALAPAPRYAEVDEILAAARARGEPPLVVVAAQVQDPQNLGAILRAAEAAGAHGVVVARHRAAGLTPAVEKASAGAAAHLPVARVANLAACLARLKEEGLWVCGADPAGPLVYYEADLTGPLALVVGSEGRGIPPLVRARCDLLVRIPMRGRVASLNVAAAAAVLLFESLRQRQTRVERLSQR